MNWIYVFSQQKTTFLQIIGWCLFLSYPHSLLVLIPFISVPHLLAFLTFNCDVSDFFLFTVLFQACLLYFLLRFIPSFCLVFAFHRPFFVFFLLSLDFSSSLSRTCKLKSFISFLRHLSSSLRLVFSLLSLSISQSL